MGRECNAVDSSEVVEIEAVAELIRLDDLSLALISGGELVVSL
jgi:hypothetical protein